MSPLDVKAADENRDSLAKMVYSRMFDWLVEKINVAIGQDPNAVALVGVLDIYGELVSSRPPYPLLYCSRQTLSSTPFTYQCSSPVWSSATLHPSGRTISLTPTIHLPLVPVCGPDLLNDLACSKSVAFGLSHNTIR